MDGPRGVDVATAAIPPTGVTQGVLGRRVTSSQRRTVAELAASLLRRGGGTRDDFLEVDLGELLDGLGDSLGIQGDSARFHHRLAGPARRK